MIADSLILEAQKAWGEGIVKIGKVFLEKGDYQAAAEAPVASQRHGRLWVKSPRSEFDSNVLRFPASLPPSPAPR